MFDAKLKEGVEYFEQMLKVMPDDRTTLEFLAVAYPQLGESEKGDRALAELARVLLQEGDLESAVALLPRLEAAAAHEAQAMAVRIRAADAPRPELVPETLSSEGTGHATPFAEAVEAEALLAEQIGETETAEAIRGLPDNGRLFLVSALAMLEKEKPEVCEQVIARLADETGAVPIPLDAFDPDRQLTLKLPVELVRLRGVIPFARISETALVATLAPQDAALRQKVTALLGCPTRFFLAEPRLVESALEKLFPESKEKN